MSLKLNRISIPTTQKHGLMDFLSDVFDMERVDEDGRSDCLSKDGLMIHIQEVSKLENKGPLFELTVDKQDEFDDIKSKIEFYNYRTGTKTPTDVKEGHLIKIMKVKDPDGRAWKVAFRQKEEHSVMTFN